MRRIDSCAQMRVLYVHMCAGAPPPPPPGYHQTQQLQSLTAASFLVFEARAVRIIVALHLPTGLDGDRVSGQDVTAHSASQREYAGNWRI